MSTSATSTMTDRLAGKAILVTGAAQGIGAAIAARCVAEGGRVALVDRHAAVLATAAALGDGARGYVADVSDGVATADTVAAAATALSGLSGLVNAAGVYRAGNAVTIADDVWEEVLAVNLTAPLRWIRAAMPHLLAAGGASIVNITSVTASHATPDSVSYVASKHGLLGLTRSVARDFGRQGVRCNAVSPGSINTGFLAAYALADPKKAAGLIDQNFVGRLGEPEEIAAMCAYLLADESGFISGADMLLDGARTSST